MFVLLLCVTTMNAMNEGHGKPPPPPYDAPGSPTFSRRAVGVPPRKDSRSSSTTTIERRTSGGHATSATNSFTPGESPKKQVSFGHLSAVNSNSEPTSPRVSMTLPAAPATPAPSAMIPALIKALEAQTEILTKMVAAQERQAQANELVAQEMRLASVVMLRQAMAAEDWVLCAACLVDEENMAMVNPAVGYLRTRWEQLIELRRRERERERTRAAEQGQR